MLEQLQLANNKLTGTIPEALGTAHVLFLNVSGNALTGRIPVALFNIKTTRPLTYDFSHNQLTGEIPSEIRDPLYVDTLKVEDNQLTGTLPEQLAWLEMTHFTCNDNHLTGTIPLDFVNDKYMQWIDVSNNELTGTIPEGWKKTLKKAQKCDFSNNCFDDPEPMCNSNFTRTDNRCPSL
eukprot:TRINITY_DN2627_c0_g2_i13.p1 TRINITY_DN2627_c0_g2~~TRINITY_DN2627_c0_g2_i13.p1  ORF type:complete len:179 (-),score=45.30 TRINITY_DN2627_c0_g2_i13:603-1139(-)